MRLDADDITWNIRDRHMVETAWALKEHLKSYGNSTPKIVICERIISLVRLMLTVLNLQHLPEQCSLLRFTALMHMLEEARLKSLWKHCWKLGLGFSGFHSMLDCSLDQ